MTQRPVPTPGRGQGAAIAGPPLGKLYGLLILALLALCAALLTIDLSSAGSALLGGLIAIAPNMFFARQAFRFRGARATRHIAQAFYLGETGKFVSTAVAFAVVFAVVRPLNIWALWAAFVATTIGHWLLWHRQLKCRQQRDGRQK